MHPPAQLGAGGFFNCKKKTIASHCEWMRKLGSDSEIYQFDSLWSLNNKTTFVYKVVLYKHFFRGHCPSFVIPIEITY